MGVDPVWHNRSRPHRHAINWSGGVKAIVTTSGLCVCYCYRTATDRGRSAAVADWSLTGAARCVSADGCAVDAHYAQCTQGGCTVALVRATVVSPCGRTRTNRLRVWCHAAKAATGLPNCPRLWSAWERYLFSTFHQIN